MTTVYILVSKLNPEKYYIGMTDNLEQRIKIHNNGEVTHTSKYIPWEIDTFIEFTNKEKAISFEKYLKSHSGRAFSKKHF